MYDIHRESRSLEYRVKIIKNRNLSQSQSSSVCMVSTVNVVYIIRLCRDLERTNINRHLGRVLLDSSVG